VSEVPLYQIGRTALHHAAKGGHASLVHLLVEAGADTEARDKVPIYLKTVSSKAVAWLF